MRTCGLVAANESAIHAESERIVAAIQGLEPIATPSPLLIQRPACHLVVWHEDGFALADAKHRFARGRDRQSCLVASEHSLDDDLRRLVRCHRVERVLST